MFVQTEKITLIGKYRHYKSNVKVKERERFRRENLRLKRKLDERI